MAETPAAPAANSATAPTPSPSASAELPTFPFKPLPPEPPLEHGDVAGNRAVWLADQLIARGHDPERVKAALAADGHNPDLLDVRTPEQKKHDEAHGVPARTSPADYYFAFPPSDVLPSEHQGAFNQDLRAITSELGFAPNHGNGFAAMIVSAATAAARSPDLAAAGERHDASLKAVVGDKYDAMAKAVNELLDKSGADIKNRKFVDALRPNGVLGRQPLVFLRLANHAAAVNRWLSTRPARKE